MKFLFISKFNSALAVYQYSPILSLTSIIR
jgi:hypothetical protein